MIIVAAAVVLLLAVATSVGRTYALWRDSVPLDGGTMSSGSLVLLADGSHSYAFDTLTGSGLAPGGSAQAPLTIDNGGTVDLDYRFQQATASGSTALVDALTLVLDRVATRSACPTGVDATAPVSVVARLYAGPLTNPTPSPWVRLTPGSQDVLCVRVAVSSTAPSAVQGTSARVALVFGSTST